jgi:drug/metabolite transporter (DMT)-like permease
MLVFQVIDAFILPITLILSYFCIKLRYKFNHLLGVIACLCGCGLIITADYLVQIESGKDGGKHRISGDILCFLASVLYAVSNVSSEMFIKQNSKLEYLSMIGFMGTAISLSQMLLLEREEISNLLKLNNLFICKLFNFKTFGRSKSF